MESKSQDPQAALLQRAAAALPPHLSLADELASLLGLSRDSAYRRLRCETELSLQEATAICRHFGLSMDDLLGNPDAQVRFRKTPNGVGMEDRLREVLRFLQQFEQAQQREIVYFSMELPFFHLLQVPELLAFKQHYWHGMAEPGQPQAPLRLQGQTPSPLHQDILNLYLRLPSTEIIYEAALSTTMMQIQHYLESGFFAQQEEALLLFDALAALVAHIKTQATLGRKFRFGAQAPEHGPADTYRLFHNEMIYSQNVVYTCADGQEAVFLEHSVVSFLSTSDPDFCTEVRGALSAIQSKSIPISAVSERERNKFFQRLEASVARHRGRAEMLISAY